MTSGNKSPYVSGVCPACRSVLYEPGEDEKEVACPECGRAVRLAPPLAADKPRPRAAVGGYALSEGDEARRTDDCFLVVCPLCSTRLHPSRSQVGQTIRCPDCHRRMVVPRPPPPPPAPARREVGEYNVLEEEAARDRRAELAPERYFAFSCPACRSRLTQRRDEEGLKVTCPDCGETLRVPRPPPRSKKRELPRAEEMPVGEVAAPPPPLRPPVGPRAIEERIPTAPPPRWTFFSGVFSFPWRDDALPRWGLITLGLIAAGEMAMAAWVLSGLADGGELGYMTVLSLALFAIPLAWLCVWVFSYTAACTLAVIEETAAGSDEVCGWPEGDWREWITALVHVGLQAAMAAAVGYGVSLLLGMWREEAAVLGVLVSFFLFPVFLLSSLETESAFVPLSLPVLNSVVRVAWAWLLVDALVAGTSLAWCWLFTSLAARFPFLAVLVTAPLLSALILIDARLFGRLGWKASGPRMQNELAPARSISEGRSAK